MSRRTNHAALALAVVSVLRAAAAGAQAAEPAAAPAADTSVGLEEVIVTAQRRSEALERTPVAISAVGSEALQRLALVTDADLQSAVPGLMIKAGANTNQLNYAIRGQSLDAFSGVLPGVLPYFNEVQVAGGGSTTLYDLQSVQVLKGPQGTLFGRNATGGTVLFTSAKPTEEFDGYAAVAAGNYGLFRGEAALNLPVSDKVLTRIATIYQTTDGYQHDSFHDEDLGAIDRFGVRGSLTLKPTDRVSNELVVDYSHLEGLSVSNSIFTIYPTGSTTAPAPANFLFTPAMEVLFGAGAWQTYVDAHPGVDPDGIVEFAAKQKKRGPYEVTVSSLPFVQTNNLVVSNVTSFEINDHLQFRNILGYTNLSSLTGAEYDGSPYVVDERGEQGGINDTEQFSEEAQLIGSALDDRLDYVVGVYFNDEKTVETTLSQIVGLEPFIPTTNQINSGETKRRSYAGYGQGTYDLSEMTGVAGLAFTLGGRYTSEKVSLEHLPGDVFLENPQPGYKTPQEDTFNKFSWNVGLEEQLSDDLLLYLHARSSVRNGGFNFFAPPLPGLGSEGGSGYDVETATDIEFGAKYKGALGDMPARLNVAIYNLIVDDAQRVTYASLFGAPAAVTVNVPETTVRGIEADGIINPATWLTLGASVNYIDAEFTDNEVSVLGGPPVGFGPVPDVPEWSGSAYADFGFPVGDLRGSFRAEVFSQTEVTFSSTADAENPGTTLPGYSLVNLRLGLDSADGSWSVAGLVRNAADKVYYVGGLGFGSLFTYNLAVPGEPRTYQMELRYRF
jgi:iron complex outermembrane receptor protein